MYRREAENKPTLLFTVASSGQAVRLESTHWLLWTAVFGEKVSQTLDPDYWRSTAMLYHGQPPQLAASVSLNQSKTKEQYPTLRKMCEVSDEDLIRIQPGCSRGHERGLIVVSDSNTIFMAGKKKFCNLQSGFEGLMSGSNILSHYNHLRYVPVLGASLRPMVDRVHDLVNEVVAASDKPQRLHIDIVVLWMGNE